MVLLLKQVHLQKDVGALRWAVGQWFLLNDCILDKGEDLQAAREMERKVRKRKIYCQCGRAMVAARPKAYVRGLRFTA